jgi:hypothetical protein
MLSCLNSSYDWHDKSMLLHAYITRKNSQSDVALINWLGGRSPNDMPSALNLERGHALQVLNAFAGAWNDANQFPDIREEMAKRAAELARSRTWEWGDRKVFEELKSRFDSDKEKDLHPQALAMQEVLGWMVWHDRLQKAFLVAAAHFSAWALLIFGYPRWAWVQSLFFWNKWGRRFLGLGYVGLLITIVPWLRRRLFLPFRASLLPRNIVEQFSERSYFPDCDVVTESLRGAGQTRVPLKEAIPRIRGQLVLKGPSGLGKTQLLLRLASLEREPVVLLRATECAHGVDVAIQRKLQGQLSDKRYLESLVYAGALKVLIDGLNEASPEARVAITRFVEKYFKGDFILTTQPMSKESWDPPSTAQIYALQPIQPEQIEPFLLQQWENIKVSATLTQPLYEYAVSQYVKAISTGPTNDPRVRVLSNPMDASLAADLLARGHRPDPLDLVQQRYDVMVKRFREERLRDFPRKRFSERVYEWRKSGEPYIDTERFETEVDALADERLMLQRAEVIRTSEGERTVNRWSFRHDKIIEFFMLPAFMESNTSTHRYYEHVDDYESFIGVYELLAVRLSPDEDARLLQFLINHAADTSKHELLDRYTLARRLRPEAHPLEKVVRLQDDAQNGKIGPEHRAKDGETSVGERGPERHADSRAETSGDQAPEGEPSA